MEKAFDINIAKYVNIQDIKTGNISLSDKFICSKECDAILIPCCCGKGKSYLRNPHFKTRQGCIHNNKCTYKSYNKSEVTTSTSESIQTSTGINLDEITITFNPNVLPQPVISVISPDLPSQSRPSRVAESNIRSTKKRKLQIGFKDICDRFLNNTLDMNLESRVLELSIKNIVDTNRSEPAWCIFYGEYTITHRPKNDITFIDIYLKKLKFQISSKCNTEEFQAVFDREFHNRNTVFVYVEKYTLAENKIHNKTFNNKYFPLDHIYCVKR